MTKEEIIEALTQIDGQGNQLDLSGKLIGILKEAVNLIPEGYQLPKASAETLGGIKVGSNLSITEEGVLSAQGGEGVKTLFLYGPGLQANQYYSHDPQYQNIGKVIQDFEAGKIRVLVDETESQYKVYQVIGSEHDMMYMWYITSDNQGQTECRLVKSVVYQNNQ